MKKSDFWNKFKHLIFSAWSRMLSFKYLHSKFLILHFFKTRFSSRDLIMSQKLGMGVYLCSCLITHLLSCLINQTGWIRKDSLTGILCHVLYTDFWFIVGFELANDQITPPFHLLDVPSTNIFLLINDSWNISSKYIELFIHK